MIMHTTSRLCTLAVLTGSALFAGQAAADDVIADDLIVQGSACVGLDCVNNESFGFDTLRLKENNTRIKFQDTSTSAGFPNNVWQLTANDSNVGGANKFSIDDVTGSKTPFTVIAGAPTNSMFVAGTGKVGFGNSAPGLNLHITATDTPAHRLEQTSGGGFTAQTWDIGANEANFFVRDLTGGSRLPFRVRPGAPTSSIDISAAGHVGIGTSSPGINSASASNILTVQSATTRGMLELVSSQADAAGIIVGQVGFFANANTVTANKQVAAILSDTEGTTATNRGGGLRFFTKPDAGALTERVRFEENGTIRLLSLPNCGAGIVSNGSGALSCLASSRQFKNVAGDLPVTVALANVMALRPQTGSYKQTPDVPEHWLIAEEVATIDPALVGLNEGKPHVVKTQNVVADLVAVVQQQQREIEELRRLISAKQ